MAFWPSYLVRRISLITYAIPASTESAISFVFSREATKTVEPHRKRGVRLFYRPTWTWAVDVPAGTQKKADGERDPRARITLGVQRRE